MQSSELHVKPRAMQVCLFAVRLLLLCVVWLVLLIGVAWAFGALWFDFPVSTLSRPLAAVFAISITSNCTSNVRLHIKRIGSAHPWDWQLLVNGSIDEHAYDLGALDTSLPFAELKRLSHINARARTADGDPAFSSRIRDGLPGIP